MPVTGCLGSSNLKTSFILSLKTLPIAPNPYSQMSPIS